MIRARRIAGMVCACLVLALFAGCAQTGERGAEAIAESIDLAAVTAEREGDYVIAANHYRSLLERRPDDLETILGLARNLRYAGRAKLAVEVLDAAQPKFADQARFLFEHGKAKLAVGGTREAIGYLNRAAKLNGQDWEIHAALGIAYDLGDSFDMAAKSYETALRLSKDNPVVLNNMAISAALAGKLDAAIRLLESAPAAARHSPQIRQNLALFYGIKGDLAKAEQLARMDLDEASVRNNLAIFSRFRAARDAAPRQ